VSRAPLRQPTTSRSAATPRSRTHHPAGYPRGGRSVSAAAPIAPQRSGVDGTEGPRPIHIAIRIAVAALPGEKHNRGRAGGSHVLPEVHVCLLVVVVPHPQLLLGVAAIPHRAALSRMVSVVNGGHAEARDATRSERGRRERETGDAQVGGLLQRVLGHVHVREEPQA
jgi:hypothetical protein